MNYMFDTLKFTQRLERAGVSRDQAEAHAELARDMVLGESATKADLQAVEAGVHTEFGTLRSDFAGMKKEIEGSLRELELRMTVKIGAIVAAAVAVIAAVQKLF